MTSNPWAASFRIMWRTLTLRATAEDYEAATWHAYVIGLMTVWLAGVGRTWDDMEADPFRRTGVGSLVYVGFLTLLVAAFSSPLSRRKIAIRHVFLFVTMTGLPAFIYAVPVERWTDMATAQSLNLVFLIFVALYRVAMFVRFLYSNAKLTVFDTVLAGMLPLMLVLILVSIMGLSGRVIDIMGGLHGEPHVQDSANAVVFTLTGFSCLGFVPMLIVYIIRAMSLRQSPVSSDE